MARYETRRHLIGRAGWPELIQIMVPDNATA